MVREQERGPGVRGVWRSDLTLPFTGCVTWGTLQFEPHLLQHFLPLSRGASGTGGKTIPKEVEDLKEGVR